MDSLCFSETSVIVFQPTSCSIHESLYEGESESKVPYCTFLLHFSAPTKTVNSAAYQATLKKT